MAWAYGESSESRIHHTTIINWISKAGIGLPDAPEEDEIPEITEIDELQTFVGKKRNKVWIWTVVNHWRPGILSWTVGNRSSQTFQRLWLIIKCWRSFWYVSDGYLVYAYFVEPEDHLISKTYMTRVEGENTRLRHYERSGSIAHSLSYSKSLELLRYSIRLLLHYLKFKAVPAST